MKEEAHRLGMAAQEIETKGLEKVDSVVAGPEVEGLYGLLGGDVTPLYLLSPTYPQESLPYPIQHCLPSIPSGIHRTWNLWLHSRHSQAGTRSCFSSCSSNFRGNSPYQYAQPFTFSGALSGCINAGLRAAKRVHQPHMLLFAHMCKVHLGVGLVCPSCSRSLFNLDTFQCHKRFMLICN